MQTFTCGRRDLTARARLAEIAAEMGQQMSSAALIAVDWGTSNMRARLIDAAGNVLAEAASEDGIARVAAGGHEAAFERLVGDWPQVPAIMAGMIASRQGGREADYLPCPAAVGDLAASVLRFETGNGRPVAIIPGMMVRSAARDGDVMRGEELQILGALEDLGSGRHLICLPGTHSKWAEIENGIIRDFRTYMTGELFDLLRRHSILGTTIEHAAWSEEGFREGLAAAGAEVGLLARLFSVRAGTLLGTLPVEKSGSYLSGLLIGSEVSSALHNIAAGSEVCIIGNPDLTDLYIPAVAGRDIRCRQLGEYIGAKGLFRLAKDLRTRR